MDKSSFFVLFTIDLINKKSRGLNSRTNEAEERISKQEDRMVEITATEQNKEKMKINKDF